MFQTIGPINKIDKQSSLSGWSISIGAGVTAFYGALMIDAASAQNVKELLPGLVLYIPDNGVTLVSVENSERQFTIKPGSAYLYSADAGPYQLILSEPGVYSGLKIFFQSNSDLTSSLPLMDRYIKNPLRAMFYEVPINRDTQNCIKGLSVSAPSTLPASIMLLTQLCSVLAEVVEAFSTIKPWHSIQLDSLANSQIFAADNYLKETFISPPSVLELANIVGLNHMTLKRGFHLSFNTTVYGRLRTIRMIEAKRLLANGKTVTEAALGVGYSNPSKFAAAFKRELGLNPSKFSS